MASQIQEIYNISKYVNAFANEMAYEVSLDVLAFMKRRVAVDKGDLKGSIKIAGVSFANYDVFARAPHAAAQEYGLAPFGKPNYRYTPYARPAASDASSDENMNSSSKNAHLKALLKSKSGLIIS